MTDFKNLTNKMLDSFKSILKEEEEQIVKNLSPKEKASLNRFKQDIAIIASDESLSISERQAKVMELRSKTIKDHGDNSSK